MIPLKFLLELTKIITIYYERRQSTKHNIHSIIMVMAVGRQLKLKLHSSQCLKFLCFAIYPLELRPIESQHVSQEFHILNLLPSPHTIACLLRTLSFSPLWSRRKYHWNWMSSSSEIMFQVVEIVVQWKFRHNNSARAIKIHTFTHDKSLIFSLTLSPPSRCVVSRHSSELCKRRETSPPSRETEAAASSEEFLEFSPHRRKLRNFRRFAAINKRCARREKWGGFSHTDFECIHQQQILTRKLFPLIWLEAAAGVVVAGRRGGNCHRAHTQIDCWLLTFECCWEDDDSSLHCENLLNKLRSSRARKVRIFPSCSLEKTFHFASMWQKRREILNFSLFSRHSWLERTNASHWQLTQMSDGSRRCRRREKKMWRKKLSSHSYSVLKEISKFW